MVAKTERAKYKSSQSVDLVELLERDVYPRLTAEQIYNWGGHDFKRSGNRLRGNPPWGQSKSGTSFTAFDDLGFLDSHNGNESGDPIKYRYSLRIGRYDYPKGRDWIETVKELFELAGVSLPEREWTPDQIKQAQRRESRQAILQAVVNYCADILWTARGEAERKHLIEERGFTEQGLKELEIGVYPGIREVKEVLQAKKLDIELAHKIGVLSKKWEGYMIFPWFNPYSQMLTIYGHQTKAWADATGKPKKYALFNPKDENGAWLHTKESPYLLNRAIRDRHKELVLVEGITDAAIAHQQGDTRVIGCVAAMLSKDQCQTLKRHRIERVIIALDPDSAGDAGIDSCLKSLLGVGISAYIAPKLPDGLDPDEFILKHGIEAWSSHIAAAEYGFRWQARSIIAANDITTDAGKEAILKAAKGFHQANTKTHSAELKTFFWPEVQQSLGTLEFDDGGDDGNGNGRDDDDWGDGNGENQPPNQWVSPTSWNGEIGWLIKQEDDNGLPITKFFPKCNFDFQIESELSSDEGGGLVLQVKRSLDSHQKRVIILSQDYGSVKDFESALKRVYKSGVVCNLKSEHLKALIHVKLREYRDRGGITYRLQDRVGQQQNGHWVFQDCQITPDGGWSASPNSDWIFNADLGGEDKMPQPKIAPPDPDALKRLVAAMRKFHGAEGIFPAMMALGFAAAAVQYRTIIKKERRFPQLNLIGDAGSNKSICAANALSLVGWLSGDGQISGVSESKLYECLKLTGSLPLCLDDPPKSRELDEILKRLYNAIPRMVRGNYQQPHSPLMVTSNHAIGDQQLATLTRMLQVPVYRQTDGDSNAWDEMLSAMETASACLPDLIRLGYPKAEIKELEQELRAHLPKSHPRIASSMALILWYAMAVARLADFDAESVKQYAITQLCQIANAADTNADSIADFLDKLSVLKSDALLGDWNCLVVETKTGKALAVQMSQVFPLIDKHFNPVYSRKVLEALIAKAGGTLQSVQKFHSNRDESLAYYRAKITAEFKPTEPEYKPKRCVLIPFHLIKGFTDDWKEPPPSPPSSDGGGGTSPHNNSPWDNEGEGLVTSPVTSVTASYSQLQKKCNQQDVDPVFVSAVSDSPVTSFLEESIKENQQRWDAIEKTQSQIQNTHIQVSEKDVTEEQLEPVTVTVNESERLHVCCKFDVTACNQKEKNVTEHPTPKNPEPLQKEVARLPEAVKEPEGIENTGVAAVTTKDYSEVTDDINVAAATETLLLVDLDAEYKELKAQTDVELKRLSWSKEQGRDHLIKVYGVRSRHLLSNEQLRDFLQYLEAQPD